MSSEASHLVCWFWGLLEVTGAGQCQIGSGVLIRKLKAIHGWWLPVLEHGCTWERPHSILSQLPPGMGVRQVSKGPKAPGDLPWPASSLLGSATERVSGSSQLQEVLWVSGSHQVRVSGVYQVSTESNTVPGLGLRSLSRSLRVHPGQLQPIWGLWTSAVGGQILGSCEAGASRVYQARAD